MFLSSLTEKQQEAFFCLAHTIVVADGELSLGEQVMMEDMRREMALPMEFEPHYLNVAGMQDVFDTRRSRAIVVISLIRLGYADGAFEIEEQSFLKLLCNAFEISETEFALFDNWICRLTALEREADDFF